MGVIDQCTYNLTCKECNISESSSVFDKGSNYSGSWWSSGPKFNHFNTSWSGGGEVEPKLVKAICKTCGSAASVEHKYST